MRNNIAVTSLNEITASFIRATGGDPTAVNLSYAQTYMYRAEAIRSIADEIKRSWKPSQILTVHWDGKLMKSLQVAGETQERLPVLVSGIHGVKLLGVPIVEGAKGEKVGPLIAMATVNLLNEWNCSNNVKAMVFDTTSSNTGKLTAACISIQNRLERELLWLPCKHHIGERILHHCWQTLEIEPSTSPEISLFVKFKKAYARIQYTKYQLIYSQS